MYKILEDIEKERKLDETEKAELKKYKKLSDAFTPLGKAMNTEYANQNTYDCIQIHGGSGFMKDYPCERYYRDARITNIYEGTTQLQVVAAIRHVLTGAYLSQVKAYQKEITSPELAGLKARLAKLTDIYEQLIPKVADTKDSEYIDFHARRLVDCTGHIVLSHLLLLDTQRDPEAYRDSAEVYINSAEVEVKKINDFIAGFAVDGLKYYKK